MKRANIPVARRLRRDATDAESLLWKTLRNRGLVGFKFRRQHSIERYVADFACLEKKLIVELDGGQHSESVKDEFRTAHLQQQGFKVLRFWNNEVLTNLEGVWARIADELSAAPSPQPSPRRGEGAIS